MALGTWTLHMCEVVDCKKFFYYFIFTKHGPFDICQQWTDMLFGYILKNEHYVLCKLWDVVVFRICLCLSIYSLQFMFCKHIERSTEVISEIVDCKYVDFVVSWRYSCHSLKLQFIVGAINILKIVINHVSKLVLSIDYRNIFVELIINSLTMIQTIRFGVLEENKKVNSIENYSNQNCINLRFNWNILTVRNNKFKWILIF